MDTINAAQVLFGAFFAIYYSLMLDRANNEYRPFDTYSAWRGSPHAIRRLLAAWTFLIILPLFQFAVTMTLLDGVEIFFDSTASDVLILMAIGLLSFFDLGYYRMFEAVLYLRPRSFFHDEERSKFLMEDRGEMRSHAIPGLLYVLFSIIILILMNVLRL